MTDTPPTGTIAEVSDWMGDDPQRAQAVIEAESATDAPRSTLIAAAQKVIDDHAAHTAAPPVEESTVQATEDPAAQQPPEESEAAGMSWDELAPTPDPSVLISPADPSVDYSAVETFAPAGEEPIDPADVAVQKDVDPEADDPEPFEAEVVTSMQVVTSTGGAILNLNGTSYGLNGDQVAALNRLLGRAGVAVY